MAFSTYDVAWTCLFGMMSSVVACSPPSAVPNPTWSDVLPVLQGQCLHCHGSSAAVDGGGYRFDFLDANTTCKQEPADDLPDGLSPMPSFMSSRRQILESIQAVGGKRPKMPPQPAMPLEDWQRETLEAFVAKLDVAGVDVRGALGPLPASARAPNLAALSWLRAGASVTLDYVVTDENHDPVIGEIRFADATHKVVAAGRGRAAFEAPMTSVSAAPIARLCDGWGVRERTALDGLPVIP